MECVIGTLSFIQMKVSGGDPDEVQVNVKGEPIATSVVDNEYVVISGEAGEYKCNLMHAYKVTHFFH